MAGRSSSRVRVRAVSKPSRLRGSCPPTSVYAAYNALNANGRYMLALPVGFQDRLPGANDPADVCLLDTLSPDGSWFVNSHREGEHNHYTFLNMKTRRTVKSPRVFMSTWRGGPLRLDPAPCWNRTSDAIVVPGIAADGTRQMFLLELQTK